MTPSSPKPDSPDHWNRWDWLALAVVLSLGALLRVPTLGSWSIWLDEAFTIHDASLMLDSPPDTAAPRKAYPLNYLLTGYALRWWGHGEVAARALPCVAGLLCIGGLYVGVRRFAGRARALCASTLLAASAWHIFWSQNARHYSLMLLCAMVGVFAGFCAVQSGRYRWALVSAAGFVLGILTHPTAVFALVGFGVFLVWHYRGLVGHAAARRSTAVVGLAGVAMFMWFAPIFRNTLETRAGGNLPQLAGHFAHYLEIPLLLAALGGVLPAWRRDRTWGMFVGTAVLVPLALLSTLGLFLNVGALYGFVVLPGMCVLAAEAVTGFGRPPLGSRGAGILIFLMVLSHEAGETFQYFHHRYGNRPRWRDAAVFLKTQGIQPEDIICTGAPALAYYLGFPSHRLRTPDPMTWYNTEIRDAFLAHPRPVWFVIKNDRFALGDSGGVLRTWLEEHAVLRATFPAWTITKDRTIYVYQVPSAGGVLGDGEQSRASQGP